MSHVKTFTFTPGTTTAFACALHVLEAPALAGRFDRYIDREGKAIAWHPILDEPCSTGERTLVDLAFCLWSGREGPQVGEIIANLDNDNFERALEAIALKRRGVLS